MCREASAPAAGCVGRQVHQERYQTDKNKGRESWGEKEWQAKTSEHPNRQKLAYLHVPQGLRQRQEAQDFPSSRLEELQRDYDLPRLRQQTEARWALERDMTVQRHSTGTHDITADDPNNMPLHFLLVWSTGSALLKEPCHIQTLQSSVWSLF